jgi:hypothetical protein
MTTAVLSFLGVIFGAGLQYVFTRYLENQRHFRTLRTQAHMDYLKCVCDQANLGPSPQESEIRQIFARTADAKSRICLYGSIESIRTFAIFEKLGAAMQSAEQRTAFIAMVAAMRRDSGSKSEPNGEDLQRVLLGNRGTAA